MWNSTLTVINADVADDLADFRLVADSSADFKVLKSILYSFACKSTALVPQV
jgi:hypothetical protein